MTNQEIISKVLSADVVRGQVREFFIDVYVLPEKHPELYEILKTAINNSQEELLNSILEACLPKACSDVGIGIEEILDSGERGYEANEDEIWIWEKIVVGV